MDIFSFYLDLKESLQKKSIRNDLAMQNALKRFAETKGLTLKSESTSPHVFGRLGGYDFSLRIQSVGKNIPTIGAIIRLKRIKASRHSKWPSDNGDIMLRYLDIANIDIPGELKFNEKRFAIYLELAFESKKILRNEHELQAITDKLVKISEVYFELWKIGGKKITQTIQRIAYEINLQVKDSLPLAFCNKCLTFCSLQQVKLPSHFHTTVKVQYRGCRLCKKKTDLIKGRSIALIDNQMKQNLTKRDNEILLNWLMHKKMFDFHEVRIIQASDREVEEFVMQVGNDSDAFRRPRYRKMPCIVSSDCHLSANTMRLLQHTFHSVKTV